MNSPTPQPEPNRARGLSRPERITLLAAALRGVLSAVIRAVLDHILNNA
ncbi:hypothetical protein EV383_6230 [Pseudonocardia sediminis]|uniref:Uncharacterized protein n=1 Tax=Pseudonocardia sediminis TaxID=1397368 RepID=A0A4Q7U9Q2_PSEST|nr:hypothetical protein EV383_6230 [Pseudonocardia sediminis]